MIDSSPPPTALTGILHRHLQSWGLRHFQRETEYFRWQEASLTSAELRNLHQLLQARGGGANPEADVRFYDLAAADRFLPLLYSQRYDWYLAVGPLILDRLKPAHRVLDIGCGIGILTTLYAAQFPGIEFCGLDRSGASIAVAQAQAQARGLGNLRFIHGDIGDLSMEPVPGRYDLIMSTQALFQAENDPGLPSQGWETFERSRDSEAQTAAENRMGLAMRLGAVTKALAPGGRLLLCEKASHLGRRVVLQRALARRGFHLLQEPLAVRYRVLGETMVDGPFYEVGRAPLPVPLPWPEAPWVEPGASLYVCQGESARYFTERIDPGGIQNSCSVTDARMGLCRMIVGRWHQCLAFVSLTASSGFSGLLLGGMEDEPAILEHVRRFEQEKEKNCAQFVELLWGLSPKPSDATSLPLYENHSPAAHGLWSALPTRLVYEERTLEEEGGRQMHLEWGECGELRYVFWANTYDQRQLVLGTPEQGKMLEDYYRQSFDDLGSPSGKIKD